MRNGRNQHSDGSGLFHPIVPLLFDGDDVTIVIIGVTQPVCDSLRSHLPLSPDPRVPAIKPAAPGDKDTFVMAPGDGAAFVVTPGYGTTFVVAPHMLLQCCFGSIHSMLPTLWRLKGRLVSRRLLLLVCADGPLISTGI